MPNPLDVNLEKQGQDNWCWASVALGIAHFYRDFGETQQCQIASRVLSPLVCCPEGREDRCDVPQPLVTALGTHFTGPVFSAGDFEFVKTNIDNGRPIAARMGLGDNGAGHFVVISGYFEDGGTQDVFVCDPTIGGEGVRYAFAEFVNNWQQIGSWTLTFQTI